MVVWPKPCKSRSSPGFLSQNAAPKGRRFSLAHRLTLRRSRVRNARAVMTHSRVDTIRPPANKLPRTGGVSARPGWSHRTSAPNRPCRDPQMAGARACPGTAPSSRAGKCLCPSTRALQARDLDLVQKNQRNGVIRRRRRPATASMPGRRQVHPPDLITRSDGRTADPRPGGQLATPRPSVTAQHHRSDPPRIRAG